MKTSDDYTIDGIDYLNYSDFRNTDELLDAYEQDYDLDTDLNKILIANNMTVTTGDN
jgi:hypothetical protein